MSFSFRVNFERTSVILSFDFPVYSNKMLLYANFAAEEGMIHLPVGTDKSDPVISPSNEAEKFALRDLIYLWRLSQQVTENAVTTVSGPEIL